MTMTASKRRLPLNLHAPQLSDLSLDHERIAARKIRPVGDTYSKAAAALMASLEKFAQANGAWLSAEFREQIRRECREVERAADATRVLDNDALRSMGEDYTITRQQVAKFVEIVRKKVLAPADAHASTFARMARRDEIFTQNKKLGRAWHFGLADEGVMSSEDLRLLKQEGTLKHGDGNDMLGKSLRFQRAAEVASKWSPSAALDEALTHRTFSRDAVEHGRGTAEVA